MRCPECAGRRSGVRRVSTAVSRSDTPYATYALIAVNVAVFIAEVATSAGAASLEGGGRLIRDGGLFGPAISNDGEIYRIVTAGFLHAGPLHLLFNMFALYVLGTLLEPGIGTPRFCGIYLAGLLAGSFGALLLDPHQNTVGASGAIFGLFGAAFLIARRRQLENLASQIGLWLVLNLVFTLSIPGISIGGHLGGLVGGTLAAFVVTAGERRVGGRAALPVEVIGIAAICALSVAGALAAASA
jgi:membrane associated rhomboid family serine protease